MERWLVVSVVVLSCFHTAAFALAGADDGNKLQIRITSVQIGKRRLMDLTELPDVVAGEEVVVNYKPVGSEVADGYVYRCRIKGFDPYWREPTRAAQFDWRPLEPGRYIFEVQVTDGNMNYSAPASVELRIVPRPFYARFDFVIVIILAIILVAIILVVTVTYAILHSRTKEFRVIPNPYVVDSPIRDEKMFFGRKSDLEFIRMRLGEMESGLAIVLVGENGIGKTAILLRILDGEMGERVAPVMLDMKSISIDDEVEFFRWIASEINKISPMADHDTGMNFSAENLRHEFEGFISDAVKKLGGRRLLLLFDDYGIMESAMGNGVLSSDIGSFFGYLLESHPRLSFIFAGTDEMKPKYWGELAERATERRVGLLLERDAFILIKQPLQDRFEYSPEVPESIFRLTGGHPHYTQIICWNIVHRLNESRREYVNQDDLDTVVQKLIYSPFPQISDFWDGLEDEQRNVLSLAATLLEDPDQYISAQTMAELGNEQDQEAKPELSSLERTMSELFEDDILERRYTGEGIYEYRFRVDLVRLWIRQMRFVRGRKLRARN